MADPTDPQPADLAGSPDGGQEPATGDGEQVPTTDGGERVPATGDGRQEPTTDGKSSESTRPRVTSLGTAPAPKKSRYALTAGDLSLRNMIWALALTIGVVAVVAMVFYGVGRPVDREVPESNRVDVPASAERAQDQAPYSVAVPQLTGRWEARNARFSAGEAPSWRVQYTTPEGSLATLIQVPEATGTVLNSLAPGARPAGQQTIAGRDCEVLHGQEAAVSTVLVCHGSEWDMVISGKDDVSGLKPLADAAIRSVDG